MCPIGRRLERSFPFSSADIYLCVFVFEQVVNVVEVQVGYEDVPDVGGL